MRLAMVFEHAFRQHEGLWTERCYGHYVDTLAPYFERILVVAPRALPASRPLLPLMYRIQASNVDLLALPYYGRWVSSVRAILRVAPALLRRRSDWDVLYLRLPCALAPPAFLVARVLRRPVCLHVCAELLDAIVLADYPRVVRPFALLAGYAMDAMTRPMARHSLTIAQGDVLARRYAGGPATVSIIESTIGDGDITARALPSLQPPFGLLYVGRLVERKGVHYLIQAVAALRREMDVGLLIVGSGPAEGTLRRLVAELELSAVVRFAGAINSDDELNETYRRADVLVLPSFAEGIARVLIEAMAQCVPVISTAVGGTPGFIRDGWNGLLVKPGSAEALVESIRRVVRDDALRGRLVANGTATARRHTREVHAREFMRALNDYLQRHFPDLVATQAVYERRV